MCRASDVGEELFARLADGDDRALAELFARHREGLERRVRRRLDRRLRARLDPADVLQEVYIDAARRVRTFLAAPTMSPGLWLRLLTDRRLLELHREHLGARMRDVRREVALVCVPSRAAAICTVALADDGTCPSQAAVRAEEETRLVAALDRMQPRDREVLVLRHFEQRSNDEVAALFGIGKAAASNRYVRALEGLGRSLCGQNDLCAEKA
jgi:RNA polymerase sigma-70 factor (ECF subfamily)